MSTVSAGTAPVNSGKQQSARRVRRAAHQTLAATLDGDAVPDRRVLGDPWGMKDGKQRIGDPSPADWRK